MLNRTGEADLDDIMIEHNGLLVDRALPDSAIRDAIAFVLRLPGPGTLDMGLSHERTFALVNAPPPSTTGSAIPRPSYVVDLQKVRQEPNGYLSLLSANSRHQISRSQREFGKLGTLLVTEAGSLDDARSYFRELLRLHSAAWRERGMSSSFEKQPQVLAFHDHFLNAAFRRGEIQLLRITAGSTTIGYLYNFVFRGRVSYYQAGFNYRVIAHHNRPGLVCHALAIMHNAAAGKMCYDFLAGEHRYKQTLSTDREWQAFCLFRRNSPIARLDGWLRRWRRGRRHLEVVAGAGLCISLVGLSLLE